MYICICIQMFLFSTQSKEVDFFNRNMPKYSSLIHAFFVKNMSGAYYLCYVLVAQSCPTLCDPMDWGSPGSSVHRILQGRILDWVAISFSRRSSQPRDRTQVSSIAGWLFTVWATREALIFTAAAVAKSLQSCPTLCDPIDGSPPGSSVPGILQARTLEWVTISFSNAWKWKVKVKSLSRVRPSATPWTAAFQAPPSMGPSRQEYWSGVPLPSLLIFTSNIFTWNSIPGILLEARDTKVKLKRKFTF